MANNKENQGLRIPSLQLLHGFGTIFGIIMECQSMPPSILSDIQKVAMGMTCWITIYPYNLLMSYSIIFPHIIFHKICMHHHIDLKYSVRQHVKSPKSQYKYGYIIVKHNLRIYLNTTKGKFCYRFHQQTYGDSLTWTPVPALTGQLPLCPFYLLHYLHTNRHSFE